MQIHGHGSGDKSAKFPLCGSFFSLSLPPLPHTESSSFLPQKPQPIHMPGRPDSFICQAVLLTQ